MFERQRQLGLFICLVWLLVGCGDDPAPAPTAVLETATPVAPTDTPVPSDTPTPTLTATPLPTDTPEPTDTPSPTATATDTPEPTATNTPAPTATATPVPPPANTPTPEPEPTADTIVLYYVSNPSDILGVFPVRPFEANALRGNMNNIQRSLQTMLSSLDGARAGDAAACNNYVSAYQNILNSGIFYDDVPGDWANIDEIYILTFIFSLDRTRPAYLSCVNAGQVDEFNYGLALQTINQTLQVLNPAIAEAAGK